MLSEAGKPNPWDIEGRPHKLVLLSEDQMLVDRACHVEAALTGCLRTREVVMAVSLVPSSVIMGGVAVSALRPLEFKRCSSASRLRSSQYLDRSTGTGFTGVARQRVPSSVGIVSTFAFASFAALGRLAVGLEAGDRQMAAEESAVVSVDWLHQHLSDPDLKVLDASWYMPFEKRNPFQEYQESHIPGALFLDIDGIVDATSEMPHMLPSEASFSAAASSLGLENHHNIVVYDGKGIFSSARVWWMFKAFGHKKVWVLDGGLPQWQRQKYAIDSVASSESLTMIVAASESVKKVYKGEQVGDVIFKAQLQQYLVWSLGQVKRNIAENKYVLVDARSRGRFDGSEPEPRKGVRGGHVPGSTCVPFTEVLTSAGTLRTQQELIRIFQRAGVSLDSPIVVSCGTGVTACVLALALHDLGKTEIPVYDGSWTEWGTSPNVPVETSVQDMRPALRV